MSDGMYALKPVFDLDAVVQVPDCMYSLPVIQSSQPIEGVGGQTSSSDAALAALSARQDTILAKLENLKDQVTAYQKSLGLPTTTSTSTMVKAPLPTGRTGDLVVRCSPSHPAYSLPILTSMLQTAGLSVYTSCHTHSSVSSLSSALKTFLPTSQVPRATAQVRLTLIWAEVGSQDCELVVSPLTQTLIKGEVNVLRYFSRLFPNLLPYESCDVNLQDELLDRVSSLSWAQAKARQPLLRQLTERLAKKNGQASFLAGAAPGASDLALFSMIKRLGLESDLQPAEVKKWFIGLGATLSKTEAKSNRRKSYRKSYRKSSQSESPVKGVKSPVKSPIKQEAKSPIKQEAKSPVKHEAKAKSPVKEAKKEKKSAA